MRKSAPATRATRHFVPSVRGALLISVLLSMAPALVIIVLTGVERSRDVADQARAEIVRQVETLAELQSRATDATQQLLSTLASFPAFRTADTAHMDEVLKAVHTEYPEYLNFTATDTRGIVVASSLLTPGEDLSDRLHIKRAVDTGRFASGQFTIGRVLSEPAMPFAMPLFKSDGTLWGVQTAVYKLKSYSALFETIRLEPNAFLGLTDYHGIRLYHYPPKDSNPVGEPIKASVWEILKNSGGSGTFIEEGSDGIKRFFAFRALTLPGDEFPYMYIVYASALDNILARSRTQLTRNIVIMVVVAAFALFLSSVLTDRMFGRRLTKILDTTARIGSGQLDARVDLPDDHSDLGRIAAALDNMAELVRARELERSENAKRLAASLEEKEILLKEIHHRVKNNFQLVVSLLTLRSSGMPDGDALFSDSIDRIRVMATIHELLYEAGDLSHVDLSDYTRTIVQWLVSSYTTNGREPSLNLDLEPVRVDIDVAIPCGLIINEVLTNSVKYAFPDNDRDPVLGVAIRPTDDRGLCMVLSDNGPGLPESIDPATSDSLGMQLIVSLSSQVGASWAISREGGTTWTFTLGPKRNATQQ
ncbi:MAG: hypothetical protein JW923_00610 [Spirochaetales bacterium]|nr:hypothetical protein [Spirochaetales bacterium]